MASSDSARPRPLEALRSLRKLIADPDDTPRVFEVIRALGGPSLVRGLRRFRATAVGQRVLVQEENLLDALVNRDALAEMPAGSLGCTYYDFVYGEALTAQGLVEASTDGDAPGYDFDDPDLRRFGERIRDQHDLWHTVTQYGRDPFGEACLLAFTYAQMHNRGVGVIALTAAWKLSLELGRGVFKAMWRAYRAGRHASWLPEQDWAALLRLPVADMRRELAVSPPTTYWQVLPASS